MVTFICIVNWTWGILQTLAGAVVKLCMVRFGHEKLETCRHGMVTFCYWPYSSGVSLGNFRFVPKGANKDFRTHEWGHSLQSAILGPMFLFVIGIPSLLLAAGILPWKKGYMEFYTEKWANKISGAYGE